MALSLAERFLNFFGFKKTAKSLAEYQKKESYPHELDKPPVSSPRLFIGNLSYAVTEDDLKNLFGEVGHVASVEIVVNRQTNRSKGFGFVTMGTRQEAERAVAQFDGETLHDRPISVSGAKSEGKKDGVGEDANANRRSGERPPRKDRERGERNERSERGERGREQSGERGERRRDRDGERDGGRERGQRRDGGGRGSKSNGQPTTVPMAVEVISTPRLCISNLVQDFGQEELQHLFAGVGSISSSQIHDGRAEIEMSSVADAQNAVRLLDGKDFMGKTLSLKGQPDA